jgi:hypothetical protein
MALEITGRIIHKLNKTDGVSKMGKAWSKQEFVIETQEQYPRKVCISVMNEKVTDLEQYNVGDMLTASLNIESREYNGKWYTDVRAWRLQGGNSPTQGYTSTGGDNIIEQTTNNTNIDTPNLTHTAEDDLPF